MTTNSERRGRTKLDEDKVVAILLDNESTNKELAVRYGVSSTAINAVRMGSTWGQVRPDIVRVRAEAARQKMDAILLAESKRTTLNMLSWIAIHHPTPRA